VKVLVIKTSSLGDILHTLPALTDAVREVPGIRFDWVVEEGFKEIPSWHPAVDEVIQVALRRWRHGLLRGLSTGEIQASVRELRSRDYDLIIDAQCLIKSAVITRLARGARCGLDRASAREPLAALAYERKFRVSRYQHAVQRIRQLFAAALHYSMPDELPDYGLDGQFIVQKKGNYLVFLHGTTWPSKHWPNEYWTRLASMAAESGMQVKLPWANKRELERAKKIANAVSTVELLPRMGLGDLARVIAEAAGIVGVDTGLVHLASALSVPCITLYGSTDPQLTGNLGHQQEQMRVNFSCAPCLKKNCTYDAPAAVHPACYTTLGPDEVWSRLRGLLNGSSLFMALDDVKSGAGHT
jgi:heptosyltransferase-1